ncbi:MAG TPA: GGDEF domain-containing protein [Steroidobacteraceae bacterium]|nr:GGDEF domain-containing protein [Steroidobacteraceae bacterium]
MRFSQAPDDNAHRPARPWLTAVTAALLLGVAHAAIALQPAEADRLLQQADSIKTSDPAGFASLLDSLQQQQGELDELQRANLHFLQGWKGAFDGHYGAALSQLQATLQETQDTDLTFRIHAAIINVLVLQSRYEEALTRLPQVLALLPQVKDPAAREHGLFVIGHLYDEVGQYDRGIGYADKLIQENWHGRGICKGSDLKLRAMLRSGQLLTVGPEVNAAIDACMQLNEVTNANDIRTYAAAVYLTQHLPDEAILLLGEHYGEVSRTGFRRLIAAYDSLLAQAYRDKGQLTQAREYALRTISSASPTQASEALVVAYRLLYEMSRQQGDFKQSLEYHEKYATLQKAYLDDMMARQLAYQRVAHESVSSRLQIESLNKQNHVLQLEKELGHKAVENSRLYIILLLMTVAFVGLWAFRTKRSQLHFMSLSQVDGLTGISNRPHFIARAEEALNIANREGQPVSIILCDLDHFKAINDKYGHAAGDLVLKRTAGACRRHMRLSDLFGRFGGEEFSFLLSGCGLDDARQRAEQLRLSISTILVRDDSDSYISASFGVASTSSSGYELRQLLAHADSALYAAKRAGRNRVVVYDTSVTVMGSGPEPAAEPTDEPAPAVEARILGI